MRRLKKEFKKTIKFTFENRNISCDDDDTVASALLESGETLLRYTPKSGSPRGPFCMMGACFECMVEINGQPNKQACMTKVKSGMHVRRQFKASDLGFSSDQLGYKK